MDDWFQIIAADRVLTTSDAEALHDDGFVVIDGPVPSAKLSTLSDEYDRAMRDATPPDLSVGSTTTRVHDFVNRGAAFDALYVHAPILDACCRTIAQPYRLSAMAGRTLHACAGPQDLHVDFVHDRYGWPMIGFILMIDEFRKENGATRFLPGSHRSSPGAAMRSVADGDLVLACGPAGAVIVYNGSVVHGHGPNATSSPRRSIQGAYIRRDARSGIDLPSRMQTDTLGRIGPLAKYLVAV